MQVGFKTESAQLSIVIKFSNFFICALTCAAFTKVYPQPEQFKSLGVKWCELRNCFMSFLMFSPYGVFLLNGLKQG